MTLPHPTTLPLEWASGFLQLRVMIIHGLSLAGPLLLGVGFPSLGTL